MNPFQILGLVLSAVLVALVLSAARTKRLSRPMAAAWTLLWLMAAVAIARPRLTVVVARALGIDRGADLVFYVGILAMLGGFFVVFGRLWRIEQSLTEIVRRLALWEAETGRGAGEDDGPRRGSGESSA